MPIILAPTKCAYIAGHKAIACTLCLRGVALVKATRVASLGHADSRGPTHTSLMHNNCKG